MAVNPVLKLEDKIQILDQTRLNAEKSFITRGEQAIADITIQPGADADPVSVFVSGETDQWHLDWLWADFNIDIDASNCKLPFKRISTGDEFNVTLTFDTYTLADLKTHIVSQLNGASDVTWTGSLSSKNELTLTASEKVELQGAKAGVNILPVLGFFENITDLAHTGKIIEWLPKAIEVNVITTDGAEEDPEFTDNKRTFYQKVYSVEGDALFSDDSNLVAHEFNILNWVPDGRNSFLDAHRSSQEKIMQWINQNGYESRTGNRITKWQLLDLEDVREWSIYLTLSHLFMGFQNSKDDVLKDKYKTYDALMIAARNEAMLKIDINEDGKIDEQEKVSTYSGSLRMR